MKPQWEAQVSDLNAMKSQWDALAARLPEKIDLSQAPTPIPRDELSTALANLVALVAAINARDDVDPVMLVTHQQGVLNSIASLKQQIITAQNSPAPQHLQQVVSAIWSIYASLVWLVPEDIEKSFATVVKDSNAAAQLSGIKEAIKTAYQASGDVAAKAIAAGKATNELEKLVETMIGREREAGTAKTNAEASAAAAAAGKQAIDTALKELNNGLKAYQALANEIQNLKKTAEVSLEGASRVGLARSFQERRASLSRMQEVWGFVFLTGIVGLIVTPTIFYDKYIEGLLTPNLGTLWPLLLRGALEAPIIWYTWFAVRQYGHTTRLKEDYAYKEATAMSFIGYKREMGDDKDMLKLLQESAIRSFGSNPVRVLGKSDPSSPAHDLLEKAIEKGGIDKAVDLAKSLFGKKE